jgi:hypothetical protein
VLQAQHGFTTSSHRLPPCSSSGRQLVVFAPVRNFQSSPAELYDPRPCSLCLLTCYSYHAGGSTIESIWKIIDEEQPCRLMCRLDRSSCICKGQRGKVNTTIYIGTGSSRISSPKQVSRGEAYFHIHSVSYLQPRARGR